MLIHKELILSVQNLYLYNLKKKKIYYTVDFTEEESNVDKNRKINIHPSIPNILGRKCLSERNIEITTSKLDSLKEE